MRSLMLRRRDVEENERLAFLYLLRMNEDGRDAVRGYLAAPPPMSGTTLLSIVLPC